MTSPVEARSSAKLLAGVFFLLAVHACGKDEPAAATSEALAIPDTAFARPWLWVDHYAFERRIEVLIRIPGRFVALARVPTRDGKAIPSFANICATSEDAVTWTEHALPPTVNGRGLAFGNGVIVAVGGRYQQGVIFTSPDGKVWTEQTSVPLALISVSFVEGRFWAFGEQGAFYTSADGRLWEDHTRRDLGQLNAVAFGNGHYVVVGNGALLQSTDRKTWTVRRSICDEPARCPGAIPPGGSPPGTLALSSVVFRKGVFVTTGAVGSWTSPDGLAWTNVPEARTGGVVTAGGFIDRDKTNVITSEDGLSWSSRSAYVTTDRALSCADRICIPLTDGILIVPKSDDPAAIPRPVALALDRGHQGQIIAAQMGQPFTISLMSEGPGQFTDATVSSGAVRMVRAGFPPFPAAVPTKVYEFVTVAAGTAQIAIGRSDLTTPFTIQIDVAGP